MSWQDMEHRLSCLSTGTSTEASGPRDGNAITEELRRNLREKGIPPPYVLVGHSLGGLYMQLYARRYPEDVAGLVLVDSTHPEQLKGAGAKDNWPTWLKLMFDISLSSAASKELEALAATGAAMLALPPLIGKPVVVLSAQQPMSETSELARDANAKRSDIVHLHPCAKQVWVDSGHAIPLEKPDAVIATIHEVLHSVRAALSLQPLPASSLCVTPPHLRSSPSIPIFSTMPCNSFRPPAASRKSLRFAARIANNWDSILLSTP